MMAEGERVENEAPVRAEAPKGDSYAEAGGIVDAEEAKAGPAPDEEVEDDDNDEDERPVVKAYNGFFPVVAGNQVEVERGGGVIFIAKDELEVEQGGGQWMIGLRKIEVEQGGAMVMVTGKAEVKQGVIGLLVSGRTELKEGSRVLMTLPQALAAGAVAGAVLALASLLKRRRA